MKSTNTGVRLLTRLYGLRTVFLMLQHISKQRVYHIRIADAMLPISRTVITAMPFPSNYRLCGVECVQLCNLDVCIVHVVRHSALHIDVLLRILTPLLIG